MLAQGRLCQLRRLGEGDLETFLAYRRDPDVARYQSWEAMDAARTRGFLCAMAEITPLLRTGHWTQIGVAAPTGGELLGDLGLFVSADAREAEIGITLSRAAQGRGIGSEALSLGCEVIFKGSGAALIWGITDIRNRPSVALLERSAFAYRHEATEAGVRERFYALERPSAP